MDLMMELIDAEIPASTPAVAPKTAPTRSPAAPPEQRAASPDEDTRPALRFITCGSVDDGKSTLIGRLLLDSRSVLQDQLANVSRTGTVNLAQFTDGLSAEREQGITIDVAYRYFSTAQRKFIIGDAPGHEQYTRNMVTAASSADAAVVLVDATKLTWNADPLPSGEHALLPQTRRHSLLAHLLRVPSIVFTINKLDAVADAPLAFANIRRALQQFADAAGIAVAGIVPISALHGNNVATADPGWCGYRGPGLLDILERLPATVSETANPLAFPVQWGCQTHGQRAAGLLGPVGHRRAGARPAVVGDAQWTGRHRDPGA
jgi:sulfate adenylyltransferase subunit 1